MAYSPSHFRKLAYITVIWQNIEYASATWDSNESWLVNSIQSFQNTAVHFIFSDFSCHTSGVALKLHQCLPVLLLCCKVPCLLLFNKLQCYSSLHDDFIK